MTTSILLGERQPHESLSNTHHYDGIIIQYLCLHRGGDSCAPLDQKAAENWLCISIDLLKIEHC